MNAVLVTHVDLLRDAALAPAHPALDRDFMTARLRRVLTDAAMGGVPAAQVDIGAINILRHKPGRRCLIEYQLFAWISGQRRLVASVLGKVRAKGVDKRSFKAQQRLWQGAFSDAAADGIHVPQPLVMLPEVHLWLQCRVRGAPAGQHLLESNGAAVAGQVAEACFKLQREGPVSSRVHAAGDELTVLATQLDAVAAVHPSWSGRLRRILRYSEELAKSLPDAAARPCHRDFHPDNVVVDGSRLNLVDLDLYCMADPALDMGNFIAHVTEFALRRRGSAEALVSIESALAEAFLRRAGEAHRHALEVYTMLALARHIAISNRISERRRWTPDLLRLCEHRLSRMAS